MTSTPNHLAAGLDRVKLAWLRLYEPRIISAVYGAAYLIAATFGIISTVSPPGTIEGVTGSLLMAVITCAIAFGGVVGAVTVALGTYWVERYAVYFIGIGLLTYLGVTAYLQVTASGQRGLTLMSISLALILMAVRFHWIGSRPYNPRLRPVTDIEP